MRNTDDDHRGDDRQTAEPSATETPARTDAVGRMLANPRRVRRA
ncbi:MAG: hypothetical protein JWR62_1274 [Modestobacter sp.]|jgi:hypothetical protein|nr:hypothetical protein [Modestobacter sp.]